MDILLIDIVDHLEDDGMRSVLLHLKSLRMAKEVFARVGKDPSLAAYSIGQSAEKYLLSRC